MTVLKSELCGNAGRRDGERGGILHWERGGILHWDKSLPSSWRDHQISKWSKIK